RRDRGCLPYSRRIGRCPARGCTSTSYAKVAVRFFKCLANGLHRDVGNNTAIDQFVRQKAKCPAGVTPRRFTATDGDQPSFTPTVELRGYRRRQPNLAVEGRRFTLLCKTTADSIHRVHVHLERVTDLQPGHPTPRAIVIA